MKIDIPTSLKKYFWGDNLADFKWPNHRKYIIQTLLERGNGSAVRWLFGRVSKVQVAKMLPKLRLSPKSSNFWKTYLS